MRERMMKMTMMTRLVATPLSDPPAPPSRPRPLKPSARTPALHLRRRTMEENVGSFQLFSLCTS